MPRDETGPGVHVFIRVDDWSALGSPDRARLVNQTRRLGVVLSSLETVYKHAGRERQCRLLIIRAVGEVIENLYLLVTELLPRSCLRSLCPFKVPAGCMEW